MDKLQSDERLAERRYGFDVDLAERKFHYERELHDRKRRVEFAEQLLADFYKFADIISAVRSPGAFGDEGSSRPRQDAEYAGTARNRDIYFVPLERLRKEQEFLSSLFSRRYQARALFQGALEEAFQPAAEIVNSIRVAASMLIQYVGNQSHNPSLFARLEADIWGGYGDDRDVIALKLQGVLAKADEVLGTMLQSESPLAARR
ncbi:hypothetical protein [Bradyrhizobium stylosanthis]|uniref:hypothetical protein n=1 Tax=Bradyrhizobium stylosanthis TaxID=1803665 RepID=UPI0012E805E8|nr:hypothetical protein [Bradyrhizobium stylosanthis]